MANFQEIEFPTAVALGATGGPRFQTAISESGAGFEQANRNWAKSRGKWDVSHAFKDAALFEQLHAFFLAIGAGKWGRFRFKWHRDFQFTDEVLPVASVDHTVFQLQKTYTVAGQSYLRTIKKPITSAVKHFDGSSCENTVVVKVAGVITACTVDHTTGLVTFATPQTPGQVTASGQFHYPVRFDTDEMSGQADTPDLTSWQSIPMVEVRL